MSLNWIICVVLAGTAVIVSAIWAFWPSYTSGGPPRNPRRVGDQWTARDARSTTPPPPIAANDLIEAHLSLRDVGYFWRPDVHMWMLYELGMKDQPVHPDDGYLVFVARDASLSGWLNGCDALKYHRLRRDAEGNIMSLHNIDPGITGQQ